MCFCLNFSGSLSKTCTAALSRNGGAMVSAITGTCDIRNYHEVTGDIICPSQVMGIDHIRDPRLNKVSTSKRNCHIHCLKLNHFCL